MDVRTIYNLMKPHLENLDVSEKKALSRMISGVRPQKISCNHRTITSVAKAKEKLKMVCRREMEREKRQNQLKVH